MNNFIGKIFPHNFFLGGIPSNKMKSFSSASTNVYVKATEEKLITVNTDYRDLFRRLLVAANAQQINLRDVLSYYKLSPVPCSLAHHCLR